VALVELLRGEPCGVERKETVELRELSPGGSEHSLERLHWLAALGFGGAHRLDDLSDRVLHYCVEESLAGREVDVDRPPDDAGAASDRRHAAVGIARQRFETGVEDGGDTSVGIGPAPFRSWGFGGGRRRVRHR
jgi:hypothetical protein